MAGDQPTFGLDAAWRAVREQYRKIGVRLGEWPPVEEGSEEWARLNDPRVLDRLLPGLSAEIAERMPVEPVDGDLPVDEVVRRVTLRSLRTAVLQFEAMNGPRRRPSTGCYEASVGWVHVKPGCRCVRGRR